MNDLDDVRAAYPRDAAGATRCGVCGGLRPGYFMICGACWLALAPAQRWRLLHARTALERVRLINTLREVRA